MVKICKTGSCNNKLIENIHFKYESPYQHYCGECMSKSHECIECNKTFYGRSFKGHCKPCAINNARWLYY